MIHTPFTHRMPNAQPLAYEQRVEQRPIVFDPDPAISVLPSNVDAVQSVEMFRRGDSSFLALIGPSGWGKSELVRSLMRSDAPNGFMRSISAADPDSLAAPSNLESTLLIDDGESVFISPRRKYQLRRVLQQRLRACRPTVVCFDSSHQTTALRAFLPCNRAWTVAEISVPSAPERLAIVHRLADKQGILLHPRLQRLIASRIDDSGRALQGALHRLSVISHDWRADSQVLSACGILHPLLSTSDWDLRDHASEIGSQWSRDLNVYFMSSCLGIGERDVAGFYSLPSGSVYRISRKVAKLVRAEDGREQILALERAFLSSLDRL